MKNKNTSLVILMVALATCFSWFSSTSSASSFAESYTDSTKVVSGMAVSLVGNVLVPASGANQSQYVGIASTSDQNLLTLSGTDLSRAVTINGETTVFASDSAGAIKKGDVVSLSRISGVVVKAKEDQDFRIGIASEDFSVSDAKSVSVEGESFTISSLRVQLIENYGVLTSSRNIFSDTKINGKNVSFIRLFAGLVLFIASLVLAGIFTFAAIKSSFLAVGRNPLSSRAVYTQLLQVTGVSVVLIFAGAGLAYLIWVVI